MPDYLFFVASYRKSIVSESSRVEAVIDQDATERTSYRSHSRKNPVCSVIKGVYSYR